MGPSYGIMSRHEVILAEDPPPHPGRNRKRPRRAGAGASIGQTSGEDQDAGAPPVTIVTARRFCAQASSFEPGTAGRSLP